MLPRLLRSANGLARFCPTAYLKEMDSGASALPGALVDSFGRRISYLRISVTDRCDFRCRYCMSEQMSFMPRSALLTLEEIALIADRCIARGVDKIRLTGGEPLVRRGLSELALRIGRSLGRGLSELTMTTNGARLADHADDLFTAGMRRINVSLDSLDRDRFAYIARRDELAAVIGGIMAAKAAGFSIKINMVALAGLNEDEIPAMLRWCGENGFDLSLIETMPLGVIDDDRADRFVPLTRVRERLEEQFSLVASDHRTGGPSRYVAVEALGVRLGFISPLTQNFCDGCNRVRLTATGRLYTCLGHDDHVDLREALRAPVGDIDAALDSAMRSKPRRHDFDISAAAPAVSRHMSVTGG